jgi:tetratricopeptide (TPR) repeat protein
LFLALNQTENAVPYTFRGTRARVFSLEEALFHCARNWKQTADDVVSPAFAEWVEDTLALSETARRLKAAAAKESFSERMLGFLTVCDYLEQGVTDALVLEMAQWERREEWEKIKERADEIIERQPERALALYREALAYEDDPSLINNAGVAALRAGNAALAEAYFAAGMKISNSPAITVNYIESLICGGKYDKAEEMTRFARSYGDMAELHYFKGEIEYRKGGYTLSVPHFEQANAMDARPEFAMRLSDAFLKLRRYDKALEALSRLPPQPRVLVKAAGVFAERGNLPAAVKSIERAIELEPDSAELHAALCAYLRQDYDLSRAEDAIKLAVNIAPGNPSVLLEHAALKKAQGKIKDYQALLRKTLSILKKAFRER